METGSVSVHLVDQDWLAVLDDKKTLKNQLNLKKPRKSN
jgi:hypothetical protein